MQNKGEKKLWKRYLPKKKKKKQLGIDEGSELDI